MDPLPDPPASGYRITLELPDATFGDLVELIDFLVRTFHDRERDTTMTVQRLTDKGEVSPCSTPSS
ncbi:MAG: hypothetical protein JWM31_24 [Solirubrobacterales bacterium]|nr:hypothetical protein [Solirubrobacterales bacterium]